MNTVVEKVVKCDRYLSLVTVMDCIRAYTREHRAIAKVPCLIVILLEEAGHSYTSRFIALRIPALRKMDICQISGHVRPHQNRPSTARLSITIAHEITTVDYIGSDGGPVGKERTLGLTARRFPAVAGK
jgi:hypothetical protein